VARRVEKVKDVVEEDAEQEGIFLNF